MQEQYSKFMSKKIVIALGGNALGSKPSEQIKALKTTAKVIVDLHAQGNSVLVCHGNGPQVGMIFNSFSEAFKNKKIAESMSLYSSGAMSQGYIGLDIQNAVYNELKSRSIKGSVASIVTQTLVDHNDEAFNNPTKPIGSFYSKEEGEKIAALNGWIVKEDSGRGYRRVVASPKPLEIIEKKVIKSLLENNIVIAGGGGGIPVYKDNQGKIHPIDAVIDKDFTASKMAELIEADNFIILTAVDKIILNFGTKNEIFIDKINVQDLQKHVDNDAFPAGSMKPKVEAVIKFTSLTGKDSYIADLKFANKVLSGERGTKIYK